MMNKICTSFEQSKKLIDLGLDPKTADMFYKGSSNSDPHSGPSAIEFIDDYYEDCVAWSLTALINLMPESIMRKDKIHDEMAYVPSFARTISPGCVYYRGYNGDAMDRTFESYGEDDKDLVDACCNMIGWLIQKGYIKIEKK